jgi:hypothetical protein
VRRLVRLADHLGQTDRGGICCELSRFVDQHNLMSILVLWRRGGIEN